MSTTPRCLVAEDSPEVARMFTVAMEERGFEVVVTHDGEAALAAFEENGFAVVILDIYMPRRSGLDVLRAIRQRDAGLPVLMVSGLASDEDREKAMNLGAFFLDKPVSLADLYETLDILGL